MNCQDDGVETGILQEQRGARRPSLPLTLLYSPSPPTIVVVTVVVVDLCRERHTDSCKLKGESKNVF